MERQGNLLQHIGTVHSVVEYFADGQHSAFQSSAAFSRAQGHACTIHIFKMIPSEDVYPIAVAEVG